MEYAIIDNSVRELCFEGYRWSDLVRIACRRNDPSFLAEKVYQKLMAEDKGAVGFVRAKLTDSTSGICHLNFNETNL